MLLFVKIFRMSLAPAPTFQKDDMWRMFFFFCWKRCSIISSIFWSNILFTKVLNDIGYDFNLGPFSNFFNLILHVLTTMKIAQSKKKKNKYDCLLTTPKSQSIQFYYKIIIFFYIVLLWKRRISCNNNIKYSYYATNATYKNLYVNKRAP